MTLILASGSKARRQLLDRLGLPYKVCVPDMDETAHRGETASELVQRLALGKARTVASSHPQGLIIGCDQVCVHKGRILGKPGSFEANCSQLADFSGQWLQFHTGLVLLDSRNDSHSVREETYRVLFRALSDEEIRHYVCTEQPWHCAGGFMAEGLGISLFEALEGSDFHTLIGLPLIALTDLLRAAGLNPLRALGTPA